jgi:hypothetical protein
MEGSRPRDPFLGLFSQNWATPDPRLAAAGFLAEAQIFLDPTIKIPPADQNSFTAREDARPPPYRPDAPAVSIF